MKLWQRTLLKQMLLHFFFVLFCLFSIYVLIDLSFQGVRYMTKGSASGLQVLLYYFYQFTLHFELFAGLSFLLSASKILFDLNAKRELVALQMAGLSSQALLTPLFVFAAVLSCACYSNQQWVAPEAKIASQEFRQAHAKKKKEHPLYAQTLEDGSQVIFQRFYKEKKELFDLFWVRSSQDIWYIKELQIGSFPFVGHAVDHFTRDATQLLQKEESFVWKEFPELSGQIKTSLQPLIPIEHRPLSTLLQQAKIKSRDQPSIVSHLHYKLALPLLPFLILFAISPVALRFSRTLSPFWTTACSLFALLGYIVFLEGLVILGENQILPAAWAIWSTFGLSLLILLPSFYKMRAS